jgi:hypothetical protein
MLPVAVSIDGEGKMIDNQSGKRKRVKKVIFFADYFIFWGE